MTGPEDKNELSGSGGHLNEEGMALFAEALYLRKEERLPSAMRSHVAACSHCRKEVYDLYTLVMSSRALQPDYHHPFLDREAGNKPDSAREPSLLLRIFGRKSGLWQLAAVFLLVIALGGVVLLMNKLQGDDTKVRNEIVDRLAPWQQSVSGDHATETLAMQRRRPEVLAEQTGKKLSMESVLRMTLRAGDFKLLSPPKDLSVSQGSRIDVRWKSDRRNSVTLMILDSVGINCSQKELIAKNSNLVVSLPPATYYYVFIDGKELLAAGTLRVERAQ